MRARAVALGTSVLIHAALGALLARSKDQVAKARAAPDHSVALIVMSDRARTAPDHSAPLIVMSDRARTASDDYAPLIVISDRARTAPDHSVPLTVISERARTAPDDQAPLTRLDEHSRDDPVTAPETHIPPTKRRGRVAGWGPRGLSRPREIHGVPASTARAQPSRQAVPQDHANTAATDRAPDSRATSTRDLSRVDLTLHPPAPTNPIPRTGYAGPATAGLGAPSGTLTESGAGTYLHKDTHFYGHVGNDGTVDFESHGRYPSIGLDREQSRPTLELPLDVTDIVLEASGTDPYGYEKRKFMAATRDLRYAMYDRACRERLSDAVLDMPHRLAAIWKDDRLAAAKRRLLIFQLWDECAEDGPPEVTRATEQIRAIIIDFVNQHLPKASEYAYSEADLAHLNRARRSAERFAPYE